MESSAGVKKKKGCLIPILIVLVVAVGLVASAMYALSNADGLGATSRGKIAKEMGITLEQADEVLAVFEACGITDYKEGVHDDLLDDLDYEGQTGYRVAAAGQKNIIVYLNTEGKIDLISWNEITFYQNGVSLGRISDYVLSQKEIDQLMYNCENAVKEILKSPSTSKFPLLTEWKFAKTPDSVVISSYVDAQNSFGAVVRSFFTVKLLPDQTTVVSFVFDGEELIAQ